MTILFGCEKQKTRHDQTDFEAKDKTPEMTRFTGFVATCQAHNTNKTDKHYEHT